MNTVTLAELLKHAVIDAKGEPLGKLSDMIVRLRADNYPELAGLVVRVGSAAIFVPVTAVTEITRDRITLSTARLDLRPFERRDGEVLLNADVLGHRLIDIDRAALVRAHDITLTQTAEGWIVTGLDVHRQRWFGTSSRGTQPVRDWRSFEALIGHEPSALVRSPFGQLRRLKAAQIADIIESASSKEQDDLLTQVHSDPELEADVFEELDDDSQAQLLKTRSLDEVASVLGRMRADDAADAILDLPQQRRQAVLDLLPTAQRSPILRLLGYHGETAGGLMGLDFVALPGTATVRAAIERIRSARDQQAEALLTIFCVDESGALCGSVGLVQALQAHPDTPLAEIADSEPVYASPQDDVVDVTTRMADFNLMVLPVTDPQGLLLGVVTVDDALEAAIPEDWRRREPQTHSTATAPITLA
ncbi:MAG: magnesium transporter [Microbacterium sp.]|uniref:Magnesium transporter n=1 Tax=Microbacterium ginsengisoli TaxID=400772 RepID=A0A0F0LVY3_9MICO|nr:CBS domain-containing protein [Microbacterium ginsengisoli]KJL37853.1 Magnesium transporter MgtE [Microbacterium ginsengisoli]MAL06433.1 magnesium transporter [Microbacterium sp.]HAN25214.1 magnesium transporter [Microbacterium ginsengisoli]